MSLLETMCEVRQRIMFTVRFYSVEEKDGSKRNTVYCTYQVF